MKRTFIRMALLGLALYCFSIMAYAADNVMNVKGIYLTQYTVQNSQTLHYLIKQAKASGIDTFVIDIEFPSKQTKDNIAMVKENGIKFVARITMFPGGGTAAQIKNPEVWQKKFNLVKLALDYGADAIQLDYIRYNTKQRASQENAQDILKIISWYKNKLGNTQLQIDVFGETSFGESKYIGQNAKLFSQSVDVLCPMVYPSHYHPYQTHSAKPYETVHSSLERMQEQFGENRPVNIIAYIEMANYHYPKMGGAKRMDYIKAQIKAVKDSGVEGWYAWSANNHYDYLFKVLQNQNTTAEN